MNSVAQVAVLAAEQRVVSPLMAIDSAVAECVAEDHEHLTVGGIAVIPRNSEVGPGDAEAFQGLVGAVRSGHPLGEDVVAPASVAPGSAPPPEQGRVLGLGSELAEWHSGLWARGWRIGCRIGPRIGPGD